MSNIQKQHKISPAIAWLTIQKFIIFYCPLDGEHTISDDESLFFYQSILKNLLQIEKKWYNICMDKQLSLSALSDELSQVRTKKREFLDEIEHIVPWGKWISIALPPVQFQRMGLLLYGHA